MRKVAFFDIDGTLFRSSLVIELIEALIDADIFPKAARDEYMDEYRTWRNRQGKYEDYVDAVVRSFMDHIKGVYYGDLADIGRQVVAEQSQHVYRFTRDLMKRLREEGYYLIAISQSPKTILDDFCRTHAFDKVYGRIYETGPQDRFTGEIIDLHLIRNKANIVSRVFAQGDFTREGSIAVGDTDGDIPLLESVERQICFNPNQRLLDHAQRMGWTVIVERKDVIYEL